MIRSCGPSAITLGTGGPSGFPGDFYELRDMVAAPPVRTASAIIDRLMGDFDNNCRIDLLDHVQPVDCLGGPAALPTPTLPVQPGECLDAFDFDGSGALDLRDFATFSRLLADDASP